MKQASWFSCKVKRITPIYRRKNEDTGTENNPPKIQWHTCTENSGGHIVREKKHPLIQMRVLTKCPVCRIYTSFNFTQNVASPFLDLTTTSK